MNLQETWYNISVILARLLGGLIVGFVLLFAIVKAVKWVWCL